MRIYVDELPKDCIDCPCESEYYCNLLNEDVGCCEWGEIHKNCPLQSLTDYTKQVRKEVVEDIKERLKKANLEIMSPIDLYSYTDNFLYQVEKEIKGEQVMDECLTDQTMQRLC